MEEYKRKPGEKNLLGDNKTPQKPLHPASFLQAKGTGKMLKDGRGKLSELRHFK